MEDDYMSDDFLVAAETVKSTGLNATASGKRQLKIDKSRADNEEKFMKKPKRDEIEIQRREEALNKPVCETTKGFAMLAKMGYKPGMSLGKKKDENDLGSGIKVPLPIEVRSGRIGLGHGTNVDLLNKSRQRIKAEFDKMKDNASRHDEILEEFRKRKKDNTNCRKLISDIINCRKTCMDLDIRNGLKVPQVSWYWKSYPRVDSPSGSSTTPEDVRWFYGNGEEADEEVFFDEMTEDDLKEWLLSIVEYLRSQYFYCIWCGNLYEDESRLLQTCPGNNRDDHEELT